jgi:ABC-type transport system involved in cytochrome bd biosynthesis fused ATPase/permease subunit
MNFSAGELQRLGLARALARKNPELIILDEPSSALDNVNRSIFIEKLKKIKDNKIILLITHDLELLKELDQIIVFEDGKIDIFDDFDEAVSKSSELNKLLNV